MTTLASAGSAQDSEMACCDDCAKGRGEKKRVIMPALAIRQKQAYRLPMYIHGKTQDLVDYKCLAKKNGNHKSIYYKVGVTGSSSRILQGVQAVGAFATPGNFSQVRSPVRSTVFSTLTPGGAGVSGISAVKPDRGYRCPEGYQYGGRFTDSKFSTCGQKLFEVAKLIGQAISQIDITGDRRRGFGQGVSGRVVRGAQSSGQVTMVREPQIPKVSVANGKASRRAVNAISNDMSGVSEKYTRLVRRDGFALTPVVSPAVLRTVPDNRDMEGATYITSVSKLSELATEDELGLLSNTGISQLKFILPKGSSITIGKARPLTIGERRKLGRTVRSVNSITVESDPAARMKAIAAEMGDAIAYQEDFKNIPNANELIEISVPGSKTRKRVKRWYYETLLRTKGGSRAKIERSGAAISTSENNNKISDLAAAVRHLNNNGDISRISPNILMTALKRSSLYQSGKIKDGVMVHNAGPNKTYNEISKTTDFEFINERFRSELNSALGLKSPKVFRLGDGRRAPYLMEASSTVMGDDDEVTDAELQSVDANSLLSIAVSDYLSGAGYRDPESVDVYRRGGKLVPVPMRAQTGNSPDAVKDFFDRRRQEILAHFEKLSALQKRNVIMLLDNLLKRARGFKFDDFANRLMLDGVLTSAEKTHLNVLRKIYDSRIARLSTSKETFLSVLGVK